MPTELRHILFKPSEVVSAIVAYRQAGKRPIPPGCIITSGLVDRPAGEHIAFRMVLAPDAASPSTGASTIVVEEEGAALLAALMLHCRERRIPIPAKATKSLQQFGTRLGLVMALGAEDE